MKKTTIKKIISKKKNKITVYISGAVSSPGVISVYSNMCLDEVIKKLGGFSKDADIERINLAMKLEDGQHYIIPRKGDPIPNQDTSLNVNTNSNMINNQDKSSNNRKININTASKEELDSIPGVGPSTADKILEYRKEKGRFNKIEDLKNISGIGDKKFEKMKNNVSVN
ncbi:helix-hairpin-helix domain-containing protein [Peptostreptococcus equinus]|uniref:Helix-hairpin-helix domain-containing protein n=1 Tax=Peptostreptococcus equinus TaxID=3003601 RepID=A0ABY7JLR7_9FIRM|nr:helix-hairpin-helix domain-containing protein [Peptostreptococcus sp. CBA3647]WAW14262.1 helix-hairpin-helix domain-containing protein [Peptostreptococcus sp. CBA3647]